MKTSNIINFGETSLGIEFGSTRIKCSLIDFDGKILSQSSYVWESKFIDSNWTYSMDDVIKGLRACYKDIKNDVFEKHSVVIHKIEYIGISAMMHGYLAFDKNYTLLTPFRTWRNSSATKASEILSEVFHFNIPARYSISHLYQAILNNEAHLHDLAHLMTLSGYVNYLLTKKNTSGICDASGMFPVKNGNYDEEMISKFRKLIEKKDFPWDIKSILPEIRMAGEYNSTLTEEGATLLDPDGDLLPGSFVAPSEGDCATGMTATNSIDVGNSNISGGTSIFGMFIQKENLKEYHREIDVVNTPDGKISLMIHCNNCSNQIDAMAKLSSDILDLYNVKYSKDSLYKKLYEATFNASDNCGNIVSYNYLAGENLVSVDNGAVTIAYGANAEINLSNFSKSIIYSSFATFALGLEILKKEHIEINKVCLHGGVFKNKEVAQTIFASILDRKVQFNSAAGEGGSWGMAILALYQKYRNQMTLVDFLNNKIFKDVQNIEVKPDNKIKNDFRNYLAFYKKCLKAEKEMGDALNA